MDMFSSNETREVAARELHTSHTTDYYASPVPSEQFVKSCAMLPVLQSGDAVPPSSQYSYASIPGPHGVCFAPAPTSGPPKHAVAAVSPQLHPVPLLPEAVVPEMHSAAVGVRPRSFGVEYSMSSSYCSV